MPLTLLAIDDDVITRRKLGLALRLEGFDVALTDLAPPPRQRFSVGILEIGLATVNGIDHAALLLSQGIVKAVVFFTAISDPTEIARARQLGPVVAKNAPAELVQVLRGLAANAPLRGPVPARNAAGVAIPPSRTPSQPPPQSPRGAGPLRTPRWSGIFAHGTTPPPSEESPRDTREKERSHREDLFHKTRGRCAYCATPLRLQAFGRNVAGGWEETHWLTVAYFGSAREAAFDNNCWPGCTSCSQEKGESVARDYIAGRLLNGLPVPEHWEEYDDLVLNSLVEFEDTGTDI